MPLRLVTIPCLTDNYAFVLHNPETDETALVDAPELRHIESYLDAHALSLTDILVTHHHNDHTEAVDYFQNRFNARVIGAAADAHRLPPLREEVKGGDELVVCGERCIVIEVYGHTVGHIAFYFPDSGYVFTGDSLMAMGCGRLFEGTAEQMWDSLSRLSALPDTTIVCSGHEYTAANARFALTVDGTNPALKARVEAIADARARGEATVPSLLSLEKATNPFLRAADPAIRAGLGMEHATDAEVFKELRNRKDKF